jgi:guanosine-3',5'-bis(diphosphate) 3'-pyrophosphohydrolase
MGDIAKLLAAAGFAAVRHRDQRRKGASKTPYINHPIEVARELSDSGVEDLDVLVAALLHDTVEDTGTSPSEIEERFGRAVRLLVAEVTDDKSLGKQERKRLQIEHAPKLSRGAKLIKLGDKISNVREVAIDPPVDWPAARKREYLDWAEAVVAGLRGTSAALERKFDEALEMGRSLVR